MKADKARLRAETRALREAMTSEERRVASEAMCRRLTGLPEASDVRTVLAYAALPGEPDPSPAVQEFRARGARVAFPRVCGPGRLSLHVTGELAAGYCGILEPSADSPVIEPREIDLVIVPGCAFDEACRRLGMGGGFYDRLLPLLRPDALRIGLSFDEQIVERVPAEPHDVAVDIVVTPRRTLRAPA